MGGKRDILKSGAALAGGFTTERLLPNLIGRAALAASLIYACSKALLYIWPNKKKNS